MKLETDPYEIEKTQIKNNNPLRHKLKPCTFISSPPFMSKIESEKMVENHSPPFSI